MAKVFLKLTIAVLGAALFAGVSIFLFDAAVWGWNEPVPDSMTPVAILWGCICGVAGIAWFVSSGDNA